MNLTQSLLELVTVWLNTGNEEGSVLAPTSISSLTCSCWSLNSPKASIIRPVSNGTVARLQHLAIFISQLMSLTTVTQLRATASPLPCVKLLLSAGIIISAQT